MPASVSKTCLARFDNNKYSVAASAVGRPVEVDAYVDRIVIRQDGRIVAEHSRSFARGDTVYDPWHSGALRNGAPFEGLGAGGRHGGVRRKLASADDGNRQMVDILTAMLTDGLAAVEAACAEAIACRCINANATKCCSSTSPASAKSFCIKSKRARAFAFAWSACRQTFGQREAQQLWKKLGLPELPAMADSFAQRNLLDLMNDKAA